LKIIIDTREQRPLEFEHPYITEVIRQKLIVGDYCAEYTDGHKPSIIFERKSLEDLFGTLSQGYKRFKKEIIKAKENKILLIIIIETSLTRISKGINESQRSGEEITQQLFTLLIRYRLPFVCCKDRVEMTRYIIEFYLAYGREYINNKSK
jgi:ERCC4-type nuclease